MCVRDEESTDSCERHSRRLLCGGIPGRLLDPTPSTARSHKEFFLAKPAGSEAVTPPASVFPALDDAYESAQVAAISRWKSSLPSRLTNIVETTTAPLTWLVGHFVPRSSVVKLVSSMEEIAAVADSVAEVEKVAGVTDIRELRWAPLSACDRLASGYSAFAERFAVLEGKAAGLGGPLLHLPQQLVAALRSILRISHCYGYRLGNRRDHGIVIDILEISMLKDPAERQDLVARLHDAMDRHAGGIQDDDAVMARQGQHMLAEEAIDLIPFVGTAVSFLFDSTFMHSVDETARRIFQERWLRRNRGLPVIAPAREMVRNSSFGEFGLALGQLVYTGGAVMGFVATLPFAVVRTVSGRRPNPIARGARAGADRAVNDAHEFLAGMRTSFDTGDFEQPLSVVPVAATTQPAIG